MIKGVNPTPLIRRDPKTGTRIKSLLEFEQSLERTRSLRLQTMYPGHGQVITEPEEVIDRVLQRHERRTEKVLAAVREKPSTPYEISRALFPDLASEHIYLALSTAIGHLDILETRGEVAPSIEIGLTRFYPHHREQ